MTPGERIGAYLPDRIRRAADLDREEATSARLAAIVDRYDALTRAAAPKLTRAQWACILDACNGWATMMEPAHLLAGGLVFQVDDSMRLGVVGVGGEKDAALVSRLQSLGTLELMATVECVERFWRRARWPMDPAMMAARIHPSDAPELAFEADLPEGDVIHAAWPRFRMRMTRQDDPPGWTGGQVRWIDQAPLDPQLLARLGRQAGEAFAAIAAAEAGEAAAGE